MATFCHKTSRQGRAWHGANLQKKETPDFREESGVSFQPVGCFRTEAILISLDCFLRDAPRMSVY
jgi:hypothetical protein